MYMAAKDKRVNHLAYKTYLQALCYAACNVSYESETTYIKDKGLKYQIGWDSGISDSDIDKKEYTNILSDRWGVSKDMRELTDLMCVPLDRVRCVWMHMLSRYANLV